MLRRITLPATCIAVWLFFYYLPAHSEPDMQDEVWYDVCLNAMGQDAKWIRQQITERGIELGQREMQDTEWYDVCFTASGKDAKWIRQQIAERGIKLRPPAARLMPPGRIPGN
jgi:hypothetical protein